MDKKDLMQRYFGFLFGSDLVSRQVRVGAGGAMLMLGLRKETQDLDLEVSPKIYRYLVREFDLETKIIEKGSDEGELAIWNDTIDLHCKDDLSEGVYVEDVWITPPEKILELKKQLDRPKDQDDIRKLEKLLRR